MPKRISSTPHLDAWMQDLLRLRAEIEKWCRQNKIPNEKLDPASAPPKEPEWHHTDPGTIPRWLLKKKGEKKAAKSGPPDQTANDRLDELLEIIWADPDIWQFVHDGDDPDGIWFYISQSYGLRFPKLPIPLWRELAAHPESHARLFRFGRDTGEISFDGGSDFRIVWLSLQNRLPEQALGQVFWKYLYEPNLDHRYVIASLQLSLAELDALRLAAQSFAKELEWCERNEGVVPPQSAPKPGHRPPSLQRARTVEAMVKALLENPRLSDDELAGASQNDPKDDRRKMAADARRLVECREGKWVAKYSESRDGRIIGRKPPRTAKCAPQGSSTSRK